jgi:hypothetical protein
LGDTWVMKSPRDGRDSRAALLTLWIRERKLGAGDRFRTDDLVLGKHALYQLSYTRSPMRWIEST